MKKILLLIGVLFSLVFAGVFKNGSISAKAEGDNVIVKWETVSENTIKEFVIKRSPGDAENFVEVARVAAGNGPQYIFVDKSVFKTNTSIYKYSIAAVNTGGVIVEGPIITYNVYLNVSSVKRTWGSLKAMFR